MKYNRHYDKYHYRGCLRQQCLDTDPLTMPQFDESAKSARAVVQDPRFKGLKKVFAAGCGDSNIVSFAIKGAFDKYLPDVDFEAVEAIELSQFRFEDEDQFENAIGIITSVSGKIHRTIEALRACQKHGITTVAVTNTPTSQTAKEADLVLMANTPPGDHDAGLRSYYASIISCTILAAAIAEVRDGKDYISELRTQVQKYHDDLYAELENFDEAVFRKSLDTYFTKKKTFEFCADGPLFWVGKFVQAKFVEVSGDQMTVIDSEDFRHVNHNARYCSDIAELVHLHSYESNVEHIVGSINIMVKQGMDVTVFADKDPKELGVIGDVTYVHVPAPDKDWAFLAQALAFIPGSIMASYRAVMIGEPYFRGGFDREVWQRSYFSPIADVL